MKEPAPWFFILLDQGFKIDAENKVQLLDISYVPQTGEQGYKNLRNSYEKASKEVLDILKDDNDYSAIGKIAKEMGSDG